MELKNERTAEGKGICLDPIQRRDAGETDPFGPELEAILNIK
jgi:hypothetical protein